ncbi:MAG: sigma-54 dependent transcriptional regulator [Syntrophomonas sp.]
MNILLVDDENDSRAYMASFIREMGHQVAEAEDGRQAWELICAGDFQLVLSDIRMPGWTGLELLQHIRRHIPVLNCDVVLFTAFSQVQTAVEALRLGAYDYLLKPINIKELVASLERVEEHQNLKRQNQVLTDHFQETVDFATQDTRRELERWKKAYSSVQGISDLIVVSPRMKELYAEARLLHKEPGINVLIEGETGTGKEILARYIHYAGEAVISPFIDINCAAIPAAMFESELFGYEPGTFTGALPKGQKGKLDLLHGGSLFMDEITELPRELQAKLLRVFQEKEYYRMGGLKKYSFEARIICATNENLREFIEKGSFRRDFYYRLSTAQLHIPPLRERREDILPLAHSYLTGFAKEKGKNFSSISSAAESALLNYDWPGNVRELRNIMERAVLMYDGPAIKSEHLLLGITPPVFNQLSTSNESHKTFVLNMDSEFQLPEEQFPLDPFIDDIIARALEVNNGNITNTARYLGMSRRSLDYRLRKKETI